MPVCFYKCDGGCSERAYHEEHIKHVRINNENFRYCLECMRDATQEYVNTTWIDEEETGESYWRVFMCARDTPGFYVATVRTIQELYFNEFINECECKFIENYGVMLCNDENQNSPTVVYSQTEIDELLKQDAMFSTTQRGLCDTMLMIMKQIEQEDDDNNNDYSFIKPNYLENLLHISDISKLVPFDGLESMYGNTQKIIDPNLDAATILKLEHNFKEIANTDTEIKKLQTQLYDAELKMARNIKENNNLYDSIVETKLREEWIVKPFKTAKKIIKKMLNAKATTKEINNN